MAVLYDQSGVYSVGTADTDFLGFTYNGYKSSVLGITRVSDGSRYNDTLTANFTPKTQALSGTNGTLYFGGYDVQKPINVSFAFDSLTESQFEQLRKVFGNTGVHDLVFDEAPYKVWSAAVASPVQMKYVCFMEDGARIYKGEGTVNFVCYYPYAHSPSGKYSLADYSAIDYPNKDQWSAASGLPNTYDHSSTITSNVNHGSKEMPLLVQKTSGSTAAGAVITIEVYKANGTDVETTYTITDTSGGYGFYINARTGVFGHYDNTYTTVTPSAYTGNTLIYVPAGRKYTVAISSVPFDYYALPTYYYN